MAPLNNKTVFWGGLACVVGLLLFVIWWNLGGDNGEGEKEKERSAAAGKADAGRSAVPRESRRSLSTWLRSWEFLTRGQGSQSAGWEPKEVEEAVRRTFLAYNRQDLPAFKAGWTEKGFEQAYELPKEKVTGLDQLSLLSFRPYTIGEFSNTTVNGKSAATEVELTYGEVRESHRMALVREEDGWKMDQDEKLDNIPKDATVVDAKLKFFIIELERTRLAAGAVAFKITNADTRPHEFIVKRVAESESEETIGMTKPLKPGENATLILTNLMPGRYVVLCNMVTRDIMPYAYGMRTEFFIE